MGRYDSDLPKIRLLMIRYVTVLWAFMIEPSIQIFDNKSGFTMGFIIKTSNNKLSDYYWYLWLRLAQHTTFNNKLLDCTVGLYD